MACLSCLYAQELYPVLFLSPRTLSPRPVTRQYKVVGALSTVLVRISTDLDCSVVRVVSAGVTPKLCVIDGQGYLRRQSSSLRLKWL